MSSKKIICVGLAFMLAIFSSFLVGNSIEVDTPNGVIFVVDVPELISVKELKKRLSEETGIPLREQVLISDGRIFRDGEKFYLYEAQQFFLGLKECGWYWGPVVAGKTYPGYRDFNKAVTSSQKKDMHYILKSMAQKSLPALLLCRKKLDAAGRRIDGIHPLRFLECIFNDEELKAYLHGVKKRGGMVWHEFISGLKGSLQGEYEIGNMTDVLLLQFADRVGVGIEFICVDVRACRWDEFVKTLLDKIPREGDSDRYDQ